MALDRNTPRNDIPFLRRRPHRPETVSNAPESSQATTGGLSLTSPSGASTGSSGGLSLGGSSPATGSNTKLSFDRPGRKPATGQIPVTTPSTGGLSIGGSAAAAPPKVNLSRGNSLSLHPKMDADLPKHSVPYFHDNLELSLDKPVVRLDARQSGIGSLVIYGAEAFAWETKDMQGGLQVYVPENSSEVEPPSFGKRRLAEFVGHEIVVGLRHARHLRRLVVASQIGDLRLTMYDGSEIFMPTEGGKHVMLISRIGHELEVRMEMVNTVEIWEAFSIKLSNVSLTRTR